MADETAFKAALDEDPYYLEFIPEKTLELCEYALNKNAKCIKFIPQEILREILTVDLCVELLVKDWKIANYIPVDQLDSKKKDDLLCKIVCICDEQFISNIMFLLFKICDFKEYEDRFIEILILYGLDYYQVIQRLLALNLSIDESKILSFWSKSIELNDEKSKNVNKNFLEMQDAEADKSAILKELQLFEKTEYDKITNELKLLSQKKEELKTIYRKEFSKEEDILKECIMKGCNVSELNEELRKCGFEYNEDKTLLSLKQIVDDFLKKIPIHNDFLGKLGITSHKTEYLFDFSKLGEFMEIIKEIKKTPEKTS